MAVRYIGVVLFVILYFPIVFVDDVCPVAIKILALWGQRSVSCSSVVTNDIFAPKLNVGLVSVFAVAEVINGS